jgi:AmmeMemoRadiSam system protein B
LNMHTNLDVRPSPIAGQWYPGDAHHLSTSVDGYIQAAKLPTIEGQIIAAMVPHAGHIYSGPVAGYAFAALRGLTPDLVVVISPSHYPYPQPLLTTAHQAYTTPLGPIRVDEEAVQALDAALQAELGFGLSAVRRDPEHSLEIELPFVQRAFSNEYRLLPVMVRDQSLRTVSGLGKALAAVLQARNAILIASTDLSHFKTQQLAAQLDGELLRRVEAFDPQAVLSAEEEGVGFACGRGAVAAVLWAAKGLGADKVKILHYATSGDVTGDTSEVVGYGAAVITRTQGTAGNS